MSEICNLGLCEQCGLKDNPGPVGHRGPLDAPVVVIGGSPSQTDVLYGASLAGDAGKVVYESMNKAGFDLDQVLFLDSIWCKLEADQEIGLTHIRNCKPNVEGVIGCNPRSLIICLGSAAWATIHDLKKLSGVRAGCGEIRYSDAYECYTVWNVAPSFVIRNPGWQLEFDGVMERAYKLYTVGEPEKPKVTVIKCNDFGSAMRAISLAKMSSSPRLALDIETNAVHIASKGAKKEFSGNYQTSGVLGVGIAWRSDPEEPPTACYIPYAHGPNSDSLWSVDEWAELQDSLFSLVGNKQIVTQNGKFDSLYLKHQFNFDIKLYFDTMVAHKLIDEEKCHGLKWMARHYIAAPDYDIMDSIPVGQHLGHKPIDAVGEYCAYDAAYTLMLHEIFEEKLDADGLLPLLLRLDMPLFNLLRGVEEEGMLVDKSIMHEIGEALIAERARAEAAADEASGWSGQILPAKLKLSKKTGLPLPSCQIGVNPSSKNDCGFILYEHFGVKFPHGISEHLDKLHRGKDGSPRTGKKTLDWLASAGCIHEEHAAWPFIQAMRRVRSLKTLYGYIYGDDGININIFPDHRVHPSFGFNGKSAELNSPVTGRLSCNSPNVQNVKKLLKPIYVADDDCVFIESDYSSLEVVIWAYLSQDPELFNALATGDFHTHTAAYAFGKQKEDVTKDERTQSKTAIFATIYGGGSSSLARTFGWKTEKADALLTSIFNIYKQGKRYLDWLIETAHKQGYVETMYGRRRHLPEIWAQDKKVRADAERQALNSPIQGSAAELCNAAALRLSPRLTALSNCGTLCKPVRIVNTVHDALLTRAPLVIADDVLALQEEIMTQQPFAEFNVPLKVESSYHHHWGGELDLSSLREDDEIAEDESDDDA